MAIKKSTQKSVQSSPRRARAIEVADATTLGIKEEMTLAAGKTKVVKKKAATKKSTAKKPVQAAPKSVKKASTKSPAKKAVAKKVATPKKKPTVQAKPKRKMAATATIITPAPKKRASRVRTSAPKMSIAQAISEEIQVAEKEIKHVEKIVSQDINTFEQSESFKRVIYFAESYLFAVLVIAITVVSVSWLALVFALFIA